MTKDATSRRRVYLPLDDASLAQLDESKVLDGKGIHGYAVTPELRESEPNEDAEGLEYLAMQDAATAAAGRDLRVVAAVDLDPQQVGEGAHGDVDTEVSLLGDVRLRWVASLHVLDPAGERDVDSDLELSWYDVTELPDVRTLLQS
ncbi:hypothetical protein HJ588_13310 [Flexivirga sp. ID2601S]|uniref:Uncharacterized protein n=1 Tax=Flexivirga aerilata TaxID=1656889 RepID=A0A849AIH2_9MICO|nr:hypothetical protein [Flexivirga aerilata]NNG40245.1 hypothetical protein [Flexivirga aerilata]